MSISRACSSSALVFAFLFLAACGVQANSVTSDAGASTPSASLPSATPESSPGTPAATEEIWLEQPFGADGLLAVLFYDEGGLACVRYLVSVAGARPSSACGDPASAALVAVQGQDADSAGQMYTVIVGRVFAPETRVVAVEMEDAESFSVNVDGGGIILIVEGERRAIQAVPIDEHGLLTGDIFRFSSPG